MIYTVFPKDPEGFEMPQDFPTRKEAKEYGESLDCDYEIESTEGETDQPPQRMPAGLLPAAVFVPMVVYWGCIGFCHSAGCER